MDSTQAIESYDHAADLRADVARRMLPIYVLAARVGLHPVHLGQVLRGRRPLTADLAERLKRALTEEECDGSA